MEKLTKEEYLNNGLASKRELNGKIFDLQEQIQSLEPGKERRSLLLKLFALIKERDEPLPDYDWNETGYDISFSSAEPKYDENGMKEDDEYNPKNWLGHDD